MIGRISAAAIAVCMGACASSGPEAPAAAATASSASADVVAPDDSSTAPEGEIHELDAPDVELTAKAEPGEGADEMVCRMERQTGSNMRVRICRRRSEIDERAAEDQQMMRDARRIKTGPHDALNTPPN